MTDETYYSLLGISEDASAAEIKTAYLRMIREVHPDRVSNAPAYFQRHAEEKTKEINEAFAVLSHPEKRRLYDAQLTAYRSTRGAAAATSTAQSSSPPSTSAPPPSSGSQSGRQTVAHAKGNLRLMLALICSVCGLAAAGLFWEQHYLKGQPNGYQAKAGPNATELHGSGGTPATSQNPESSGAVKEIHFTPEQLKEYYAVYTTPDVQYLRALFDAYSEDASGHDDEFKLLKQWSPDYFRSKYIVYSRRPAVMGGTEIALIFQQKPDRVFVAWIYFTGENTPELRSFQPSEKITDEGMTRIRIMLRSLLDDKEHAMPSVTTDPKPANYEIKQLDISRPMETTEFTLVCPARIGINAYMQAYIDWGGPSLFRDKKYGLGCQELHGGIAVRNVTPVIEHFFTAEVLGHEVWITDTGLSNAREASEKDAVTTTPVPESAPEPPASVPGRHDGAGLESAQQSPVESGANGLQRIGGGVSAPVPVVSPEAEFSDEARTKKIQGVVLVSLIVDADGNPQNPRVIRSLGYGLDEKAIEAVKKYKFKPAMKDGKTPVPVMITIEVNMRLY
jgi:TonB family protein